MASDAGSAPDGGGLTGVAEILPMRERRVWRHAPPPARGGGGPQTSHCQHLAYKVITDVHFIDVTVVPANGTYLLTAVII